MSDIWAMSLNEYQLRMEAYELQRAQVSQQINYQAWANQTVQATTGGKKPKPKYKKFNEFFDYQNMVDEIRSNYEPDYQPQSKKYKAKKRTELIIERSKEFHALKKAGKIIPLSKRKGDGVNG